MSQKVLITGGLGFVGSHIAERLVNRNYEVVIIARHSPKVRNIASILDKVKIEYGSVTDQEWLRGTILKHKPEVIFHLAGQLTSYESFEKPFYDVDVNAKSTLSILEAIRELKKSCRFILGSTFWVVGRPRYLPINEETPCYPKNLYAVNRLASEHYCRVYHAVYDLDTVVMRLSNTFGVREQHDNPKKAALNFLVYKAYKGQDITIYSEGKGFRDYVYVSDVVSAAEAIMDKGKAGECYIVGSGQKTWFYDIGKWLEELTTGHVVYVEPPDFHNRIDIGNIIIDNARVRSLGWEPRISVYEGMKLVLDYYRQEGF